MTRQEALERFRLEVKPILEQSKVQFYEVLEEKVEDFVQILQDVLERLKIRIEELEKEKIMFFHFSLMRIGILQQTYEALVQAMDARWYLDTEIASVPFSLDILFPFFHDIRKQLTEKSRKYQILDRIIHCNKTQCLYNWIYNHLANIDSEKYKKVVSDFINNLE